MTTGGTPVVSNLTYGPAGELLTMTYGGCNETRTYNDLYQLTRLTDTPPAEAEPPSTSSTPSPPPRTTVKSQR